MKDSEEDPYYKYIFEVIVDITLALIFGLLTNKLVSKIRDKFTPLKI